MRGHGEEEAAAPLLEAKGTSRGTMVASEWWAECKLLWRIVGPAIFQRVALYGINVVAQAFIGHIGDLELAAFSIASTVVAGFNFGFLVRPYTSFDPSSSIYVLGAHRERQMKISVLLTTND
jgi:MATE family multidrug resistance protein